MVNFNPQFCLKSEVRVPTAQRIDGDGAVVVTGGAGFIGSHVVGRLLDLGCEVVVIDDLSTGRRENLAAWAEDPRLEIVVADVADGLEAPLSGRGPVRGVIHLAAQISVARSLERPLEDLRVNTAATLRVLSYARRHAVARVVFASSAAVYGDSPVHPTDEASPTHPLSPYGIHKLASEQHLACYERVHGLSSAILRFFNVYGPRQDPSSAYSGVISIFAERALAGEDLLIYGDGGQTRDFVYVGDVADALVRACFSPGALDGPMNVGTGRETSVKTLAETILAITGSTGRVHHGPARSGDIYRSVAHTGRIAERLAFTAQTSVEEGLAATVAWMRGDP